MRYLTVAAHPDDEILGCGATMARLSSEGDEIHIVILGEGVASRYSDRDAVVDSQLDALRKQAQKAGTVVGAKSVELESLPDNRFDDVALLDIIKVVEKHIERVEPDAIFTHHKDDLNVDHRLTCQAVVTATRTIPGNKVLDVMSFEIPSSTEWSFGVTGPGFSPNMFMNVGNSLERKIEAMSCYSDEMRPFPHPRSARALEAIATRWGSVAGFEAAEAFEIVRQLRP